MLGSNHKFQQVVLGTRVSQRGIDCMLCDFARLRSDLSGSDRVVCLCDKTRNSLPVNSRMNQSVVLYSGEPETLVFLKQGIPSLCTDQLSGSSASHQRKEFPESH